MASLIRITGSPTVLHSLIGKLKSRKRALPGRSSQGRCIRFETLEGRQLLATLTVGSGEQFSTIQQAVNNARPGDTVQISTGTFSEGVNLSLMGSAVSSTRGDLTIRGAGANTIIDPTSGPAISNASAFTGDLIIENLRMFARRNTAASEKGLILNDYHGDLRIANASIESAFDGGAEIINSTGTFTFDTVEIANIGDSVTDHGIVFSGNNGAVAFILDSTVKDASGDGIVVQNTGSTQFSLNILDSNISGDAVGFVTTNHGLNITNSDNARLDLSVVNSDLDDLDEAAIKLTLQGNSVLSGRVNDNNILNIDEANAVDVRASNTAQLALRFFDNTVTSTKRAGFFLNAADTAKVNAMLDNVLFTNIGDQSSDEALVITSAAGSNAVMNVLLHDNEFVNNAGNSIHVEGQGNSTYNVAITNNTFANVNSLAGDEAAVFIEKASASTTAKFHLTIASNHVNDTLAGGYLLEQRGSGVFQVAGTGASVEAFLASTDATTETIVVNGGPTLVAPGSFDATVPLMIEGTIFVDVNSDGVQQPGEPGTRATAEGVEPQPGPHGVRLELTGTETVGGKAVNRTIFTDDDGRYEFPGLFAGNYTVTVFPPAGFSPTFQDVGSNDARDSDFNSNRQATRTLTARNDARNVDAGITDQPIHFWQNPDDQFDVNDDTILTPFDALLVINALNGEPGPGPLPIPPVAPNTPPPFVDVSGDDSLFPIDALLVINKLNEQSAGEGEWSLVLAGSQADDRHGDDDVQIARDETVATIAPQPGVTLRSVDPKVATLSAKPARSTADDGALESLIALLAADQ